MGLGVLKDTVANIQTVKQQHVTLANLYMSSTGATTDSNIAFSHVNYNSMCIETVPGIILRLPINHGAPAARACRCCQSHMPMKTSIKTYISHGLRTPPDRRVAVHAQ